MGDDTPTSILTKGQREYLRGEKDPAQERTMKTRIRRRVQQAVAEDVPLLVAKDRPEEIDPEGLIGGADLPRLREGLEATAELVYDLASAAGHDPEGLFDDVVREKQQGRAEQLMERISSGDVAIDPEDLQVLKEGGVITSEAYMEGFKMFLGKPGPLNTEELQEAMDRGHEKRMIDRHDLENIEERIREGDPDLSPLQVFRAEMMGLIDEELQHEYFEQRPDRDGDPWVGPAASTEDQEE